MSKNPDHGSHFLMAKLITNHMTFLLPELNEEKELNWLSPDKQGHEHQLNYKKILKVLGFGNENPFDNWWPLRQPQWDGIALGHIKPNGKRTLYLFEAKSYPAEMYGKCKANQNSLNLINDAMKCVNEYNSQEHNNLYQFFNRIAFLNKMRNLKNNSLIYDDVKLVFLLFYNDISWKDYDASKVISEETWKNNNIMKMIPPQIKQNEDILFIYINGEKIYNK